MTEHGETSSDITTLLQRWHAGQEGSLEAMVPKVIGELRTLARRHLAGERREISLEATELVGELYLRLEGTKKVAWKDRAHFFNIASNIIRRILTDRVRRRMALKRPEHRRRISFDDLGLLGDSKRFDPELLIDLDRALDRLAEVDERQARILQQRFFLGLKISEIAEALEISEATVKRDLHGAKKRLAVEMIGDERTKG